MPALLVCVEGSASDEDARACREQFQVLDQRAWSFRPSFVDQVDEVAVTTPGELPALRTVGAVMNLPDTDEGADEDAVRSDVTALFEAFSDPRFVGAFFGDQ